MSEEPNITVPRHLACSAGHWVPKMDRTTIEDIFRRLVELVQNLE